MPEIISFDFDQIRSHIPERVKSTAPIFEGLDEFLEAFEYKSDSPTQQEFDELITSIANILKKNITEIGVN